MSETSRVHQQSEFLSGNEFVSTLVAADGDLQTILQTYPNLATRFTSVETPGLGRIFDPANPEMPIAYSDIEYNKYQLKAGDSVLARGTFWVVKPKDEHMLRFIAEGGLSGRGRIYEVGHIDATTAQAFINYGPSFTEVVLGVMELSDGVEQYLDRVSIESISAIQEPLNEHRIFAGGEVVHIEGVVSGYIPDPDDLPQQGLAVFIESDRDRPVGEKRLIVMLPNGQEVSVWRGGSSHIEYSNYPGVVNSPQTPSVGDSIRIVASCLTSMEYGYTTEENRLHPIHTQLLHPSVEREADYKQWQEAIKQRLDDLAASDSSNLPQALQDLLLESTYRTYFRPKFNLNDYQKDHVVFLAKRAFLNNPEEMPLAVLTLENRSEYALNDLAEATQNVGVDILKMNKAQVNDLLRELNMATKLDSSHLPELLASVYSVEDRLNVASMISEVAGQEGNSSSARDAIRSIAKLTEGIFSKQKAETMCKVMLLAPQFEDKYEERFFCEAVTYYLEAEIITMSNHIDDDASLGDQIEAFNVYCDAIEQFESRFNQHAKITEKSTVGRAAFLYYQAARRQV